MTRRKKTKDKASPHRIDQVVISQSDDDSAWEPPIQVSRSTSASLKIPGELAARVAFLAKLNREIGVDAWVEGIIRERVELEERAFNEVKKKLAS